MNCGDCKHWKVDVPAWNRDHELDGRRECLKIDRPPSDAPIVIVAYDWDGACVRTKPEFYCSLWEAK